MTDNPVPGYAVMDAAHTTTGLVRAAVRDELQAAADVLLEGNPAMTDPERRSVTDVERLREAANHPEHWIYVDGGIELYVGGNSWRIAEKVRPGDGEFIIAAVRAFAAAIPHDATEPAGPLPYRFIREIGTAITEPAGPLDAALLREAIRASALSPLPLTLDEQVERIAAEYARLSPGAPREDERLRRIEAAARDVDGAWSDTGRGKNVRWSVEAGEALNDLRTALNEPSR